MTNVPKNLKRKRRELALKERRLKAIGRELTKGHTLMEATVEARDSALMAAEAKGRRAGYLDGLDDAQEVVEFAKTIGSARKKLGEFITSAKEAKSS